MEFRISRKQIFLTSLFISLLSPFFIPSHEINSRDYSLGFPIRFIAYHNNIPDKNYLILHPDNILFIQFKLDFFVINILIIYYVIKIMYMGVIKFKKI